MLLNSEWVVLQSLEESNRYTGGVSKEITEYVDIETVGQSRYDLNTNLKHIAIEFDVFGYRQRKDGLKFLSYNLDTKKNEYTDVNYWRGMYVKERLFSDDNSTVPRNDSFINPFLQYPISKIGKNVVDILYSAMHRNKIQQSLNFKNKWRIWYTIDGKEIPFPLTLTQCFTLVVWDPDKDDWCFKELYDVKVGDRLKGIYDDVEIIVESTELDKYEIDYVLGTKTWGNYETDQSSMDFDLERPFMICSTNKTMYMRPVPYVDSSYIKFELSKLTTDIQKSSISNARYQTVLNGKVVYGYNCPIDRDKDQSDQENQAGHLSVTSVENAEENFLWGKEFEKMFVCVGMFNSLSVDKFIEAEKTHNILYNDGIGADHRHGFDNVYKEVTNDYPNWNEKTYTGNVGVIKEGYQKRDVNLLRVIIESLILNTSVMSGCKWIESSMSDRKGWEDDDLYVNWIDTPVDMIGVEYDYTKFIIYNDDYRDADANGSKLDNIVWNKSTYSIGRSCLIFAVKLLVWLNSALSYTEDDSDTKMQFAAWYNLKNDETFKNLRDNLTLDKLSTLVPEQLIVDTQKIIQSLDEEVAEFKFFDDSNQKLQIFEWYKTLLSLSLKCTIALRDDVDENGNHRCFSITNGTPRHYFDINNAIECTISRLIYLNNYSDYTKLIIDKWLSVPELKSLIGDGGRNPQISYLNQIRNDIFENPDRWGCFYQPVYDNWRLMVGPTKLVRDKIYKYTNDKGWQKGINDRVKNILNNDDYFIVAFLKKDLTWEQDPDKDSFLFRWWDITGSKKWLNQYIGSSGSGSVDVNRLTGVERNVNMHISDFKITPSFDYVNFDNPSASLNSRITEYFIYKQTLFIGGDTQETEIRREDWSW